MREDVNGVGGSLSLPDSGILSPPRWWLERLTVAGIVLACIAALDQKQLIQLFIVLGQAHFLLAYHYQAKAGRWDWCYAPWLILAFIYLYHLSMLDLRIFTFIVATSFAMHFPLDECKIAGIRSDEIATKISFFGLLSILSWSAGHALLPAAVLTTLLWLGAALLVAAVITQHMWKTQSVIPFYFALIGFSSIAFVKQSAIPQDAAFAVWAFIILCHFAHWYMYVYRKYRTHKIRQKRYVIDVVWFNAIVIGIFLVVRYALPEDNALYTWLFSFKAFLCWTTLHVYTMFRKTDIPAFSLMQLPRGYARWLH